MSKILIIDRDKSMRELIRDIVEDAGFQTLLADSGADALNIMKDEQVDVVIIDIMLADACGLQVLEYIKNVGRLAQVVLITPYGTTEMAVQALNLGVYHYLNKPFNINELVITIKQAVKMKNLISENTTLKKRIDLLTRNPDSPADNTTAGDYAGKSFKEIVADVEKKIILKALNDNNWNRQQTARALNLNRRSLYDKIKEYKLDKLRNGQ